MKYITREKLYNDMNNVKYLRENSFWYKKLSRRYPLEDMTEEMKAKYGLRFKDKVEKIGTGMDLINAFMNVTKE